MTEILISLITAVLAGGLGWFLSQSRSAAIAERARLATEAREQAEAELVILRRRATELEAKSAVLEEAQVRLKESFGDLSREALSQNSGEFIKLAGQTFGKLHQQSADELAKRQQAIDALVKPLRESLQKVDATIGELEKSRANAYGQLSEQLKTLGNEQLMLRTEAAKLSTALRSTTTAGTWGELQLRRVVEMSGMASYCDFVEQESSGALRADLVVRLPGGQQIVVDSKAPNDAYREAVNASDETVRAAKLAEHAAKVRGHIDALGGKAYWEQFQPSPEFVVLFLPGDQFLAGALQADATLIDRAIAKKVLLATPATLIALLKAAAYGWRQEDVSKNAQEIADLGRTLYDRITTFAGNLDDVGRGLENAIKSFNKAVGSFEQSLLPGARRFSELGAKGTKTLGDPAQVEATPRDVVKRT